MKKNSIFSVFFFIFFLFISCNLVHAKNIEHSIPTNLRQENFPGESFLTRHKYWISSVMQHTVMPFFTMSSRSTSFETSANYDFCMGLSGKNCNLITIVIYSDELQGIPVLTNQFGKIIFDDNSEYNFKFYTENSDQLKVIYFYQGNVDRLIHLMKKNSFMRIEMPSINKIIYYDLRGFTSSLSKAYGLCRSVN